MKNILITGKNSYIGNATEKWLKQWPEKYTISKISMRDESWKKVDFSKYEVVIHVAGIAHVSTNHTEDEKYFRVNRDLAKELADKCKGDGVRQLIYMSSRNIYDIDKPIGELVVITPDTKPKPSTAYGQSKLEADLYMQKICDSSFKTVCVRSPMVYGKDCKGNFSLLERYADRLFILPKIDNCRSMIHVENLTNFIKEKIDKGDSGVYWPQNFEYVSTNKMVEEIRRLKGKKTRYSYFLSRIVQVIQYWIPQFRKIYGSVLFEENEPDVEYIVNDFKTSISKSVNYQ